MKFQQILSFLTAVAFLLTSETRAQIAAKNVIAKDSTLYVRKQITPGNVTKLIDGKTLQIVGITNIDGNKLEKFRNQIVSAISIKYGTDATVTDPSKIDFLSADIPAPLRNADLILTQGSRVIFNISIATLIAGKNSSPSNVEADRFNLMVWALIKEQESFELNLEFPDGADLGANNHFVEVSLFGAETTQKS